MNRQTSLVRILLGYALLYVALEGAGRVLDGLGLAAGKSATALVGVVAAVLVERLVHGQHDPKTLLVSLGFAAPDLRVLGTSVAVNAALLASLPAIVGAGGSPLVLPDDWPALALGILLLNGLAEEAVYRGYLFRRLRDRYAFRQAVVLGTVLAAAAHLPLVVTAGWVVGLLAVLVAVLTYLPFAVLFERGKHTIWAPALVHAAADCIIPLGALGLVGPLAIGYWMGAQVVACSVAAALAGQRPLRTAGARVISPARPGHRFPAQPG